MHIHEHPNINKSLMELCHGRDMLIRHDGEAIHFGSEKIRAKLETIYAGLDLAADWQGLLDTANTLLNDPAVIERCQLPGPPPVLFSYEIGIMDYVLKAAVLLAKEPPALDLRDSIARESYNQAQQHLLGAGYIRGTATRPRHGYAKARDMNFDAIPTSVEKMLPHARLMETPVFRELLQADTLAAQADIMAYHLLYANPRPNVGSLRVAWEAVAFSFGVPPDMLPSLESIPREKAQHAHEIAVFRAGCCRPFENFLKAPKPHANEAAPNEITKVLTGGVNANDLEAISSVMDLAKTVLHRAARLNGKKAPPGEHNMDAQGCHYAHHPVEYNQCDIEALQTALDAAEAFIGPRYTAVQAGGTAAGR
jgi:hypothetical protein